MEYIQDRGHYDDLPFDDMVAAFESTYGGGKVVETASHDEAFHGGTSDDR